MSPKSIGDSPELWKLISKYVTKGELATMKIYSKRHNVYSQRNNAKKILPFDLTFIKVLDSAMSLVQKWLSNCCVILQLAAVSEFSSYIGSSSFVSLQ